MEINIWKGEDGVTVASIQAKTGRMDDGTPKKIAKAYKEIVKELKEDK